MQETEKEKNDQTPGAVHTHTHTHTEHSKRHKYSQKYIRKIKKRILGCTFGIAMSLMLIAGSGLADFSMPINTLKILNQKKLSADETGTPSEENTKPSRITITEDGIVVCESIVQGIRDCNLEDGNYTFRVTGNVNGTEETKDYAVELINYYDDVTYSLEEGGTSRTISLGDDTTDYKMLAVKYHKNLTIDAGVTLTATNVSNLTYKKGMYICVLGDIHNNGTISMTARGTYNQAGENVYLWKNIDDSYEYVPAVGGAGGTGQSATSIVRGDVTKAGLAGQNGSDKQERALGGGGSGGLHIWREMAGVVAKTSAGSNATSYSGGSGSGSVYTCNGSVKDSIVGADGVANGGAGGAGYARQAAGWTAKAGRRSRKSRRSR